LLVFLLAAMEKSIPWSTHQMRDSQGIRGATAKLSCTRTMNAMLA
jgi:hypothetical protein